MKHLFYNIHITAEIKPTVTRPRAGKIIPSKRFSHPRGGVLPYKRAIYGGVRPVRVRFSGILICLKQGIDFITLSYTGYVVLEIVLNRVWFWG